MDELELISVGVGCLQLLAPHLHENQFSHVRTWLTPSIICGCAVVSKISSTSVKARIAPSNYKLFTFTKIGFVSSRFYQITVNNLPLVESSSVSDSTDSISMGQQIRIA